MDLKLFLDPVSTEILDESRSSASFQKSIFVNNEIMHDIDGIDLAIIGVTEFRGGYGKGDGFEKGPDKVRSKLYDLSKTSGKGRILDLGNLRNGPTAADSRQRLEEVLAFLLQRGIVPIVLGGSHDMDLAQFRGYQPLEKLITCLNVDPRFDLDEKGPDNTSHIGAILKHDPNFLFNYIHLGYQTYFVEEAQLAVMEKLYFETLRLGEIHDSIEELEPTIRDADMVSFDVSAIKSEYCPGVTHPGVFGLTGEEACQICWYAGLNDKLSSIGFYEFDPSKDREDNRTAAVIATMIWYFIDGFYHRKGDKNFMSNDYLVYEVALGGNPDSIRFYKSKLSEKWWMEIPDGDSDSIFLRNKMIPCSYTDYKQASEGEVPERWINAINKIN